MGDSLRIGVLGALAAWAGDEPLPLSRPRVRALLALLALHGGRVVSVDALADALWGGRPPPPASQSLKNTVSQLRAALGPNHAAVVTTAPGYALELPPGALDAARFEQLVDEGAAALREGDAVRAQQALNQGLALWRGPAYAEVADE